MDLSFLTPLYERPGPWASVYADTSTLDEATPERRELHARQACRDLLEQGADEATGYAVYDALASYTHGSAPAGRAVFARGGAVVLDPPLAARPPAPVTSWSALPRVGPLLGLAGEEPVCLVAYIDRKGADFELRTTLGSRRAGQIHGEDWPVHRTASDDWSERHFQRSVENTWERNARDTAEALSACQEESRAGLVVLAGDERERRAVHDALPQRLQPLTVETDHGGRSAGADSRLLDEDVERARQEHARRRAAAELERFRSARSPSADGGIVVAAEGVPALVDAAREHRISELLVDPDGPDAGREVWVGDEPHQLAVRRTDARYLSEGEPHTARADDALLRSAAMTGAEAIRVPPAGGTAPDAGPAGGLGALLRWARPDGT
ncbi:Vms1/Ankzf1 family peptidyl-tRNA hydrolase [Streptomyces flavidovirens]|uniref:baeRF2 domain-containing protein n=1 Tax=Streptomyces flavidovirens TaxID=67298 RepID=UPI0036CD6B9D